MRDQINISPIIYSAIEVMQKSFGGITVELLSEMMFRTEPKEFYPLGVLGVNIQIQGIKTFLSCELAEDIACTPNGNLVADSFVFEILKKPLDIKLTQNINETIDNYFSLEEKICEYFNCHISEGVSDMRHIEFDYTEETVGWIQNGECYQADVYCQQIYIKEDLMLVYLHSDFGGEYIAIFNLTKRNKDIWE